MSDYQYGLGEFPVYLFNEGTNYKSYEVLGVHKYKNGYRFAVWAPNAKKVSVACGYNDWTGENPFAFECELRPNTASVVRDIPGYKWTDAKWIKMREKTAPYDKPMLIYEVHAGSWRKHSDNSFYTYRELADELIPYVKQMGYTHIELMPLTEFPFDGQGGKR